jgi:hypothetical protein
MFQDAPTSPSGSLEKREQQRRYRFLEKCARRYYELGGVPITVDALMPGLTILDDGMIEKLARRMLRHCPAQVWKQGCIPFRPTLGGELWKIYLTALPHDLGQYCKWDCISERTGWSLEPPSQMLQELIDRKAVKLSDYRKRVRKVGLLIHADGTRRTGFFHVRTGLPQVDNRGFDLVDLLIDPHTYARLFPSVHPGPARDQRPE